MKTIAHLLWKATQKENLTVMERCVRMMKLKDELETRLYGWSGHQTDEAINKYVVGHFIFRV